MDSNTLDYLVQAVITGGTNAYHLQQYLDTLEKVHERGPRYRGDFVTEADILSQEDMVGLLVKHLPDIPIVAEEDVNPQVKHDTYITIDPLDATWIYANGASEWGVTAGYIEKGELVASALYMPVSETLVRAEKGKGASINSQPIELNNNDSLSDSIFHLVNNAVAGEQIIRDVHVPLIMKARTIRNYSSCIGGTIDVLEGRAAAFANPTGYIWDFVGALAIEEAGGAVSDYQGRPLDWGKLKQDVVFAASKDLLDEIIDITREPYRNSLK